MFCADTAGIYKAAGATLGVTLRLIPSGSHKLGPYHVQNVNALHQRIKDWFRFFDAAADSRDATAFLRDALIRTAGTGPVPL